MSNTATVRLYPLSEEDAAAQTLVYGPMSEALAVAHQHPEAAQAGLWLATENPFVAFLDLEGCPPCPTRRCARLGDAGRWHGVGGCSKPKPAPWMTFSRSTRRHGCLAGKI
jgi:hypothetical protein